MAPRQLRKLKAPFTKEWDEIKTAAESSAAAEISHVASTTILTTSALIIFTTCSTLTTRRPFHPLTPPPRNEQANSSRLSKVIKDLRDPLSNHGDVEFSYDDSHHLLNCARLTLGYLKLSAAAVEIQKLMRNLSDAPLARARHKTRIVSLPSEDSVDVDFIGRAPELDKLSAWLSQPTNKRVLLVATAGRENQRWRIGLPRTSSATMKMELMPSSG